MINIETYNLFNYHKDNGTGGCVLFFYVYMYKELFII